MHMLLLVVALVIATAVGYKLLRAVPPMLHTPLMSGMNALSGVTLVAALAIAGAFTMGRYLGAMAIVLAGINIVGGFLVTHRMLKMFKKHRGEDNS